MKKVNPAKALYHRLRQRSATELWTEDVPAFDRAAAPDRVAGVAVVRAVGVVFSETGSAAQKAAARAWLRTLLEDPEEKIRRYAMAALPKLGGAAEEESALLGLLEKSSSGREKSFLSRSLEKLGGRATLAAAERGMLDDRTARKVRVNVVRQESPGALNLGCRLTRFRGLRLILRCRAGLEEILEDEVRSGITAGAPFRWRHRSRGLVVVEPTAPFNLADVLSWRCFYTVGFAADEPAGVRGETGLLAAAITTPVVREMMETFTDGPVRYRLEFVSRGHQRQAVREVADAVQERCPVLLNDARQALWQIALRPEGGGAKVEVMPRWRPDPRFAYRRGDVPAASHPPLAACMARLAERRERETVWDPFCGSGLELIERGMLGGVRTFFGTDRSAEAVATARSNLEAAGCGPVVLVNCDFRDHRRVPGLKGLSLIVTNPPMGRRVPIPDLPGLLDALFAAAADTLQPGGRLVLANPLAIRPRGRELRQVFRRRIDLGGFFCHLEKYIRVDSGSTQPLPGTKKSDTIRR